MASKDKDTLNVTEIIQEASLNAAAMVVEEKLKQLQYDLTVEGIVTDSSKADLGIYKVKTTDAVIQAYSRNEAQYQNNDAVYVTIPQGDYKNDKFIIGKKANTNEDAIYDYQFPFEDFLKLKKLCECSTNASNSFEEDNLAFCKRYRANQREDQLDSEDRADQMMLWEIASYENSNNAPLIGDKLGITMDMATLLTDYRPISGNYGLKIELIGSPKTDGGFESTEQLTKSYLFDITNMYGNPYSYPVFTTQQVVFDINDVSKIGTIRVSFWQDCDFIDEYGNKIPWSFTGEDAANYGGKLKENIFIKNIEVYTGFAASQMTGTKVFLSTYDGIVYGQNPDSPVSRENLDFKHLYVAMVYKDPVTKKYTLYDTPQEFANIGASIYWYVKDQNWTFDTNVTPAFDPDKNEHKYCSLFWAPMSRQNAPSPIASKNEAIYYNTEFAFQPDINIENYSFRVAVAIDGSHILSDVITLSNYIKVNENAQSLAINDKVILRVAMMLIAEDGSTTVLYPDDSFQNFFVYDENNRVLHTSDTRTINYEYYDALGVKQTKVLKGIDNKPYSDIDYFLEVWIRDDIESIQSDYRNIDAYVRLADWKDETNRYAPFEVEWDMPADNASMMHCRALPDSMSANTYYAIRDSQQVTWPNDSSIETLFDVDQKTTIMFNIEDVYDFMRSDNIISAKITRNGQTFTAKREFVFGKALAQGCDYTPIININTPEGNQFITVGSQFELECVVYDKYGAKCQDRFECTWSILGESGKMPVLSYANNDTNNGIRAKARGILTQLSPLVVTVNVTGPVEYTLHAVRGLRVCSDGTFLQDHTVICPDRVEFNSTGQAPTFYTGNFVCRQDHIVDDESQGITKVPERFFYPIWKLHFNDNVLKNIVKLHSKSKYVSEYLPVSTTDSYDSNKTYFSLGNTNLEYERYDPKDDDNDKTEWNKLKAQNVLFYSKSLKYYAFYEENGQAHNLPDDAFEYYLTYSAGKEPGTIQGKDGTLWQWRDEYRTDIKYLTWLSFDYIQDNRIINFIQTIAYDRKLYPSSLVNNWDGTTLTLDQENGAVLATMIAAGTKDHNNRFTGIMMGNWVAHGDETFDSKDKRNNASGIYGFKDGESSFAFKDDGTGYIGPAGAGRIQFDGQNALISNSTQSCYINLNPIIGTDFAHAANSGISPYFLYCRVPANAAKSMLATTEENLVWADSMMKDENNNYFAVDPSRGVVISGGIISRYGRIGNWYINDSGLYQKYEPKADGQSHKTNESRYMYLGMPTWNKDVFNGENLSDLTYSLDKMETTLLKLARSDLSTVERVWYNYKKQLLENDAQRQIALGESVVLPEGAQSQTEYAFSQLYPYLDKSAFSIDVFHYFSTFMAVQDNLDYIRMGQSVNGLLDKDINNISSQDIENFRAWIYDFSNLLNRDYGLLRYENVNEYLHNHYNGETPTTGIQGTFPTLINFLGLNFSLPRTVYYYSPSEGYTNYASSVHLYVGDLTDSNSYNYTSEVLDDAQQYYTQNRLGIKRVYSYTPEPWYTNTIDTNVSINNSRSGVLTFDIVPSSSGMPTESYWKPVQNPSDTNETILNIVWNTAPKTSQYTINREKINSTNIDYDYLVNTVIPALKIYCDYYRQLYNQCLYYMLQSGLEKTRIRDENAYNNAMTIIDSLGGMEAIRSIGLSNLDYTSSEVNVDGLSQEEIARIQKAKNDAINIYYDNLRDEIKNQRNIEMRNAIQEFDKNQYCIYAGYNKNKENGLFTVNWRGYMTARAGKIGTKSPWYISDEGLTQKNNFGTIYLGNPKVRSDGSSWSDMELSGDFDDNGKFGNLLLPNDSEENTVYLQDTEQYAYKGTNNAAIEGTEGNPKLGREVWLFENNRFKYTRGNFAIYAGKDNEVNFGVRMDGTLYSNRGYIGGWGIFDTALIKYDWNKLKNNQQDEKIALDTKLNQIRLANSQIVLDGEAGDIFVGVYKNGATRSNLTLGEVGIQATTLGLETYHSKITGYTRTGYILSYNPIGFGTSQVTYTPAAVETTLYEFSIDAMQIELDTQHIYIVVENNGVKEVYEKDPKTNQLTLVTDQAIIDKVLALDGKEVVISGFANQSGLTSTTVTIDDGSGEITVVPWTPPQQMVVDNFQDDNGYVGYLRKISNRSIDLVTDGTVYQCFDSEFIIGSTKTNSGNNLHETVYSNNGIKLLFGDRQQTRNPDLGVVDYGCALIPLTDCSLLGLERTNRWVIYAHQIYIDDDIAATLSYVDKNDKILQENIIAVNNKVAEAMSTASAALSSALTAIAGVEANQKAIQAEISNRISAVSQAFNSALQNTVGLLNSTISYLEGRMDEQTSGVYESLNATIDVMNENIEIFDAAIAEMRGDISTNANNISSLEGRIGALEAELPGLRTWKAEHTHSDTEYNTLQSDYNTYKATYTYETGPYTSQDVSNSWSDGYEAGYSQGLADAKKGNK